MYEYDVNILLAYSSCSSKPIMLPNQNKDLYNDKHTIVCTIKLNVLMYMVAFSFTVHLFIIISIMIYKQDSLCVYMAFCHFNEI